MFARCLEAWMPGLRPAMKWRTDHGPPLHRAPPSGCPSAFQAKHKPSKIETRRTSGRAIIDSCSRVADISKERHGNNSNRSVRDYRFAHRARHLGYWRLDVGRELGRR